MKKYILILGTIWESDPLQENFATLIRDVDNIVESDDIWELEQIGSIYLSEGGMSYKILDKTIEHEGVAWSNKAFMQYQEITGIDSLINNINLN